MLSTVINTGEANITETCGLLAKGFPGQKDGKRIDKSILDMYSFSFLGNGNLFSLHISPPVVPKEIFAQRLERWLSG